MATTVPARTINRILVYLSDAQNGLSQVHFPQCLLELCLQSSVSKEHDKNKSSCKSERNTTYIKCYLEHTNLIVSASTQESGGVLLKHPPFCPMLQISQEEISGLPKEISSRGVDVGVVAILQSSDNRVLLTRRAAHMRTFPSTWVPPGGHIEEGETLFEALAREVLEETGINIEGAEEKLLCAWESVYPYVLTMGQPKRHHLVLYYLIKLQNSFVELEAKTSLEDSEVDGACWIDRNLAKLIAGEEGLPNNLEKQTLKIQEFCKKSSDWIDTVLPYSVFLAEAPTSGPDRERVSTGTRFALEEWLKTNNSYESFVNTFNK